MRGFRLAAMSLRDGESDRAVSLLEPVLPRAVDDLELVPLLARAYVAEGRANDAKRVVDEALARRRDAAELWAARGAVQLAEGHISEALASLRRAAEARPQDADLQTDLGDAARRAGELPAAHSAFDAALALRPDHTGALIGLARLALAEEDFDEAERRLEAASETDRDGLEVARVRGELAVLRGDGALGAEVMAPLARRYRRDPIVLTELGWLQAQAEDDRDAGRSFARALRRDHGSPEALLGQSLILVRRGALRAAHRLVARADREIQRRGPTPALQAQLAVARGRLEFEGSHFDDVVRLANEAVALDEDNATAHLLLANVAIERDESPIRLAAPRYGGARTAARSLGPPRRPPARRGSLRSRPPLPPGRAARLRRPRRPRSRRSLPLSPSQTRVRLGAVDPCRELVETAEARLWRTHRIGSVEASASATPRRDAFREGSTTPISYRHRGPE